MTIYVEHEKCVCQNCGKEYKIDLNISDELWEQIKPKGKTKGAGLLCGSCIMEKLEDILNYSAFDLVEI